MSTRTCKTEKHVANFLRNITIATFSEFALYKKEAYEANLWAGKILEEHGVPVAYKSDHVETETNAKYLLFQAATAHSFHLSEKLALQSVTSVPAKSLEIDHRVGYTRAGYDADLVVWDSHPLSIGATALQVFIDGKPTLDPKKVAESLENVVSFKEHQIEKQSALRKVEDKEVKEALCAQAEKPGSKIVITGITESFLDDSAALGSGGNYTMVVDGGKITCFNTKERCATIAADAPSVHLQNGHVSVGLTAYSSSLGLTEIWSEASTTDGDIKKSSGLGPEDVVYAKYGVRLEGKAFSRARIGGVTRAITPPRSEGFAGGVSVGIKTSGKKTVLNGGVFQDEIALHFHVGQGSKGESVV